MHIMAIFAASFVNFGLVLAHEHMSSNWVLIFFELETEHALRLRPAWDLRPDEAAVSGHPGHPGHGLCRLWRDRLRQRLSAGETGETGHGCRHGRLEDRAEALDETLDRSLSRIGAFPNLQRFGFWIHQNGRWRIGWRADWSFDPMVLAPNRPFQRGGPHEDHPRLDPGLCGHANCENHQSLILFGPWNGQEAGVGLPRFAGGVGEGSLQAMEVVASKTHISHWAMVCGQAQAGQCSVVVRLGHGQDQPYERAEEWDQGRCNSCFPHSGNTKDDLVARDIQSHCLSGDLETVPSESSQSSNSRPGIISPVQENHWQHEKCLGRSYQADRRSQADLAQLTTGQAGVQELHQKGLEWETGEDETDG